MRLELGVTTMNLPWNGIAVVSVLVLLQAIPVHDHLRPAANPLLSVM